MSMLSDVMVEMLEPMDADVQVEISRLLFEKFGGSLEVKTKSTKRSSKVPYWIREVTTVDSSKKGFDCLVGSWCKADKVDSNGSTYIVGIRADYYKGGGRYAIVHKGSGIELDGFNISGVSNLSSEVFHSFKDLMSYLS